MDARSNPLPPGRSMRATSAPRFTQAVKGYPEVLECHITLGTIDCMLRIVTTTLHAGL